MLRCTTLCVTSRPDGKGKGVEVSYVAIAFDGCANVVHAQPKALEHRGQVPGINRLAIHDRLTTHRVQPGAIQQSRQQWVTDKSLVHPGATAAAARASASATPGSASSADLASVG
jgi:hypothetical protein